MNYLNAYIDHLEGRGLSPHTVTSYHTSCENWLEWCNDQRLPIADATGSHVEQWKQGLHRGGVSASTVNLRLTAIREFYRWLRLTEQATVNASVFDVKGMRTRKPLPKPVKQRTVRHLIDSIDTSTIQGLRDKALISMLYITGARISEVCDLMCSHVDLDSGTARIEAGKGNKTRVVPVRGIEPALDQWLTIGRPECYPVVGNFFVTLPGRKMKRWSAEQMLRARTTAAGLRERITPHVLRHSCATHLVEAGAGLESVQKLLGHESIQTTLGYVQVSSNQIDQAHSLHPLRTEAGS